MIQFHIPGEPVAKGRPRFTKTGRVYTDAKTVAYERRVAACAAPHRKEIKLLTGPLRVEIHAIFKRPLRLHRKIDPDGLMPKPTKPDIDNVVKGVLDGLNAIWRDDSQVVYLVASKSYSERSEAGRVDVTISLSTTPLKIYV